MSKYEDLVLRVLSESALPAGTYPTGANDKSREAIDLLHQAVRDRAIPNVVFQNAKQRLNRNIEDITQNNRGLPDLTYKSVYEISNGLGLPWDLTGVKRAIKSLQAVKTMVNPPENVHFRDNFKEADLKAAWPTVLKDMNTYLQTLESWLPVIDLLAEVKPLVVKGRQPNPNAVPAFEPKRADAQTEKVVVNVLNKLAEPLKPRVVDKLVERDEKVVQRFADSKQPTTLQGIWSFFKSDTDSVRIVSNCLDSSKRAIAPDYREKLRASAVREVNDMVARFVAKNVEKIAPLLANKEGSEVRVLHGALDGIGFSGEISFKFRDGTGFVVRNKVVMKWTARMQQFLQFPTTFHSVVFPDGKTKAMQSEEQMHKEWLSV